MAPTIRKSLAAKSKFGHKLKQKRMNIKKQDLELVVEYCIRNNCRGYAAISAGVCPTIKDQRTINKRLDGKIITGSEKEYCSILTVDEEELVVKYIKSKNRALQPVSRNELNKLIFFSQAVPFYSFLLNKTIFMPRNYS